MKAIHYREFNDINSDDFLPLLNAPSLRTHLVAHPLFDSASIADWVRQKLVVDAAPGCRVRAVYVEGVLAGWCGIQADEKGYELAIVIGPQFWGAGLRIFRDMMFWAAELGHRELVFHLLETRPEYRFLRKQASRVEVSELLGRKFTSYVLPVPPL